MHVKLIRDIALGCYGGCSESGANTNEDAYLILSPKNEWKFITLLDAHSTIESALFLLRELEEKIEKLVVICEQKTETAIPGIQ